MALELKNLPPLHSAEGTKPQQVAAADIDLVGQSGRAFAILPGDVLKFDEGSKNLFQTWVRKPRENEPLDQVPVAYWVPCWRTNTERGITERESFINLRDLVRRDVDGVYLDSVRETLDHFAGNLSRIDYLISHPIKCEKQELKRFAEFKDGKRVEGGIKERQTGLLEWA